MKIELKSIKYAAFASEETNCYSAALYVNGKKVGTVGNEGRGGADTFHGDHTAFQRADEWCKANLPKWAGYGGSMHDTDLEIHCADLLAAHLASRDLKRILKSKIIFIKPADGQLYEIKHEGMPDHAATEILKRHPRATVLNLLPFDEALNLFRNKAAS